MDRPLSQTRRVSDSGWPTPRRALRLVAETLLHTLLLPGAVLVGLPWIVLEQLPEIGRLATGGLPIWLLAAPGFAGVVLATWLCWDFIAVGDGTPNPLDPPRRLVATGLYRFVRNPGYLAVFAILLSEALVFASTSLLLYLLLVVAAMHGFVVRVEEPGLRARFGDEYERFCESVPRWIAGSAPRKRV